jgi:hypothetical protein
MMTQLVLEGSGIEGCSHELNKLGFYLSYPFVFVRVITLLFTYFTFM